MKRKYQVQLRAGCCCSFIQSLQPHGLQHTRLPCPSLSPRVCSNSYPLSQWCYPTILSSITLLFSCPQSFPGSGSFPMSQLFTSDGQSVGTSASASALPVNIKGWFPLGLTDLISFLSKGLSRVFFSTTIRKHQFFGTHLPYGPTLTSIHDYWKSHSFRPLLAKWCLCLLICCLGLS